MNATGILASYEWFFLSRYPPGQLDDAMFVGMLREWIADTECAQPGFETRLRLAAIYAARCERPKIIRQGVQCLSVVGTRADIPLLSELLTHSESLVSQDARTCICEIEQRRS
jgi:hypothetical protein